MKQNLHFPAIAFSAIILGCFLFCNTACAAPCSPVFTDTIVSIACGHSVSVGTNNYDSTGVYSDTLTASSGCDSIVTLNLTVASAPTSTFTASSPVCPGQNSTITYTGTATAGATYAWNFAGGTPASGTSQGPYAVNWASGGTENVTLVVTQSGCKSDTTSVPVIVNSVYVTSLYDTICQGNSFSFKDSLFNISGTYHDSLTSAGGCDSVVNLYLTILPQPLQPFIVQQGNTLVSSIGNAYQWYLNDTILAGDTSSTITPAENGNYTVDITGSNGCLTMSAYFAYPISGIQPVAGAWDVSLYPNPNNGVFVIQFSDNTTREVAVTDMSGQIIVPARKVTTTGEFDLSALAAGTYFLKITEQNNAKAVFKQLVVQH